jgi:hypothetical protein
MAGNYSMPPVARGADDIGLRVFDRARQSGSHSIHDRPFEPAGSPPRLDPRSSHGHIAEVSSPSTLATLSVDSGAKQIDDMVLKMKDQLAGKAVAIDEPKNVMEVDEQAAPTRKRKTVTKSKAVLKKPAAQTGRGMNEAYLLFPKSLGKRNPSHHNESTIYTDVKKKSWRLKLKRGDKHELYFAFTDEPKVVWASMVKKLRESQ